MTFPTDEELRELGRTDDVPDGWEPDCDNCRWHLEHYAREDCYLFTSLLDHQKHVNARYGAAELIPT